MEHETRKKDVPPYCCADDDDDLGPQLMPQKSSSGGMVLETKSKSDTWRTYDGSPSNTGPVTRKASFREPTKPIVERRVQRIVVPRESSSKLKWILLAVATTILLGVAYKKYVAQ